MATSLAVAAKHGCWYSYLISPEAAASPPPAALPIYLGRKSSRGVRSITTARSGGLRHADVTSSSESIGSGGDHGYLSVSFPSSLGSRAKLDPNGTLLFSALVAAFLAVFAVNLRKSDKDGVEKLPPGPKGLPILGDLLSIGNRPYESLAKMANKYGPLMTVNFGMVKIVVVSSSEMAEEMLLKHDEALSGRPALEAVVAEEDYLLSMAWSSGQSSIWKKLRKITNTELFTPRRLDSFQSIREETMRKMINKVDESMQQGESGVQLARLVFNSILSILSNTLFSRDMFDDTTEELKDLIKNLIELVSKPNVADYIPFLKPFDPQGISARLKVLYKRIKSVLEDIITKRVESRRGGSSARKGDFLDLLLDYSEEHGSGELSDRNIRVLLMDLIMGGTHTTTVLIEWTMAELLRNPPALAELKRQLSLVSPPGKLLTEKETFQVPYLLAIVKETLRLHPVAPFLMPHLAEEGVVIDGYTIPKGTQVLINAWNMFRDPRHWEDPSTFKPERFMEQDIALQGKDFRYIPFGFGRRVCPGSNLAVRVVFLLVANLVHSFEWEAGGEVDMTDGFGMTLYKLRPLVVKPLTRYVAQPAAGVGV
ncbi:hypothetical protein M569_08596 [Genlisea aurea]|uniref:Cytochrome P450 n=1 Tax=Genlisea aurea TaxID=192259 RepID=S8CGT1_9LAMI|nr:hypothetical protein M569_08596 [Genlisea aurea]